METTGRYLMIAGIALLLIGAGIYLSARFGLPLGRLPGDIRVEREGFSFHFPLASSILVSIVLTIIINVILRLLKK